MSNQIKSKTERTYNGLSYHLLSYRDFHSLQYIKANIANFALAVP